MEIKEIIRRWQAGNRAQRRIAALGIGLSRDTVRKYLAAAQAEGIAQDGPAPSEDQLSRLATISLAGTAASGDATSGPTWSRGRTRSTSGSPRTVCR